MRPQRITVALIVSAASLIGVLLVSQPAEAQKGPRNRGMTQSARMGGGPHGYGNVWGNPAASRPGGHQCFCGGATAQTDTAPQRSIVQYGAGARGHGDHGGGKGGPLRAHGDAAHNTDMKAIQFLMANRAKIHRTVVYRPDGVETLTESDDPKVTAVLVEHVDAMYRRVKEQRPIHARDPLFAELFRNAATLDIKVERTAKGVQVVETSPNAFSAKLIQAHAQVVSLFLANGRTEMRKNHAVPK